MTTFLLVLQALIGAALVGVILMQQSEGGGLGMGGSPSGLMSARGAADFLTRATAILASLFVALSIIQAVRATRISAPPIDTSLARPATATPPPGATQPVDPLTAPGTGSSGVGAPITIPLANERPAAVPLPVPPVPAPRAPTSGANVTRERTPPVVQPRERPARAANDTPAAVAAPTPAPAPAPAPTTTNSTVPIAGGGNSN